MFIGFFFLPALNDKLMLPDGTAIYIDMKDGEIGYNTDPERGADTFHPFSSIKKIIIKYSLVLKDTSAGENKTSKECSAVYTKNGNKWNKTGDWSTSAEGGYGNRVELTIKSITLQ